MISAYAEFLLAFDSDAKARAIYLAIKPESKTGAGPSDRANVKLHLNGNEIGLEVSAVDAASFRACVNTYSRWIKMSKSLMEV